LLLLQLLMVQLQLLMVQLLLLMVQLLLLLLPVVVVFEVISGDLVYSHPCVCGEVYR
jgi:hypothetical protein